MNDDHGPAPRWSVPSWRRVTDFILTVAQLERSYQSLKADNEALNKRVAELEEKLGDQGGQLKIMASFVQAALDRQIETKAEQTATRVVEEKIEQTVARNLERLLARRSKPPADDG